MEQYKGYYIEDRWATPSIPYECVVYESEERMTRGVYSQIFNSVDHAKNWIDAQSVGKTYLLTSTGFDAMEVLAVFHKQLGAYGPSPTELEISERDIKENVIAQHVKDNISIVLQQMVDMRLIYKA